MYKLSDSVSVLSGVGPRYLNYLKKLGVQTVKDLLWYFPFRYEDFSRIKKINELNPDEKCSVIGVVKKINVRRTWRKKMMIIEAVVEDATGQINAIWFNQSYLIRNIPVGATISLSGKTKAQGKKLILSGPSYEIITRDKNSGSFYQGLKHTGRLVPIYSETKGLSSRSLRHFINSVLHTANQLPDTLPESIRQKNQLMELKEALHEIHFPSSLARAQKAKERFIFESLLLAQIYLLKSKAQNALLNFPKINPDISLLRKLVKSLPFALTDSQKKAIWEIARHMDRRPMNRLLEGEVGSGKTVVAMAAALLTVKSRYQVGLMAPTEILARQHFGEFKKILRPFRVKIALLTSSAAEICDDRQEKKITKKTLGQLIAASDPLIVIGTHALIQKNIRFNRLGLIIVDEQHRFGIEQRKQLIAKNANQDTVPHLLSMTATPIPRTLALAFYGDLDISILDKLPAGRKEIITQIVTPSDRPKIYDFVRREIKKGRQAFVICPRIEETDLSRVQAADLISLSEKLSHEVKAAKKEYKKLSQEIFPDLKVEMLHGKMKPREKEAIMRKFQENKTDLLISTSIIEVGVDIPNASLMIIEGAEHFGLAQLHQFRGRIGRSHYQSYCFLFTESRQSQISQRLKVLVKCHDGFSLAEMDLSLRGPGEFLGTKQSGVPDIVMSSLLDKKLIEKIRRQAEAIIRADQTLKKWPALAANFREFTERNPKS